MQATLKQDNILSYPTLLLLVDMIKKFKQEERKDEIINVVMAVANDVKLKEQATAEAIKDEVEEKFKNELATKDFVRAEIQSVRAEIQASKIDTIKWLIGSQVAIAGLVVAILKLF